MSNESKDKKSGFDNFFDAIFNGDDYQRGAEDGKKAAKEGRDRDFSDMHKSWKFVFHGSSALNSYAEGYKRGYDIGLFQKDNINITTDNMSNNSGQVYEREMEALLSLYNFLVEQCNRLIYVAASYGQVVNFMAEAGISKEAVATYSNRFQAEDIKHLGDLWTHIKETDLFHIQTYMQMISEMSYRTDHPVEVPNLPVPETDQSGEHKMNSRAYHSQSLTDQADAVAEMIDFLASEYNAIKEAQQDYLLRCQKLEEDGVPREMCEHYRPHAEDDFYYMNTACNGLSESRDYMAGIYNETVQKMVGLNLSHSHSFEPLN